VRAAALRKVVKLSAGWRIEASSIECSHGWAQAAVTAPTPEQQGDGVVLFKYDAAAGTWVDKGQGDGVILFRWADGKWKLVTEGSAIDCASHGVPRSIGRRLSACYYD
jgi:hypothetical protein